MVMIMIMLMIIIIVIIIVIIIIVNDFIFSKNPVFSLLAEVSHD